MTCLTELYKPIGSLNSYYIYVTTAVNWARKGEVHQLRDAKTHGDVYQHHD